MRRKGQRRNACGADRRLRRERPQGPAEIESDPGREQFADDVKGLIQRRSAERVKRDGKVRPLA